MGNSIDSKPVLQESIRKICSTDNITDEEFWSTFWGSIGSCEDTWECITQEDVRKLVLEYPGNCQTLLQQAIVQLSHVVDCPLPNYFPLCLSCVRVLTRVCPVVLEPVDGGVVDDRVFTLLWREPVEEPEGVQAEEAAVDPGAMSMSRVAAEEAAVVQMMSRHYVEAAGLTEPRAPEGADAGASPTSAATAALAVRLIDTAFHLLFLPALTVGEVAISSDGQLLYSRASGFDMQHVWNCGVGTRARDPCVSTDYDSQRVEILRLLSALFCDSLYQRPRSYDVCRSLWLEAATCADASWTGITLCSLLNSVLGYDPVGWGVPYSNLVAADSAVEVMKSSLHVLLVLLDYGLPMEQIVRETARQAEELAEAAGADVETATGAAPDAEIDAAARMRQCENTIGFNSFRRLLSTVRDPRDLDFMFTGFMRLFTHMHYYYTTLFAPSAASVLSSLALNSSSYTPLTCDEEVVLLLWRCLQEIPALLPHILEERAGDVADLVVILLNSMLIHRKSPARANYVYLCTFILLRFSADRSFAVLMNQSYNDHDGKSASAGRLRLLSGDVPLFYGSYMDLIVLALGRVLSASLGQAPNMVQCWLTILANISPYCKALCVVSAMKLCALLDSYATAEYIVAHDLHYIHIVLLLEACNNVVQYQYDGNSSLVYALLRAEGALRRLEGLQYCDLRGSAMEAEAEAEAVTDHAAAVSETETETETDRSSSSSSGAASAAGPRERGLRAPAPRPPPAISPEFFAHVRAELNAVLFTPLSLLNALLPRIMSYINKTNKCEITTDAADLGTETLFDRISGHCSEIQIYNYIRATTLVGLLPRPHAIVVRPFITLPGICAWISIYTFSVVAIALQDSELPLFDLDKVSLFTVRELAGLSSGNGAVGFDDSYGNSNSAHNLLGGGGDGVGDDEDDDDDGSDFSGGATVKQQGAASVANAQQAMQRT